jgi:ABC transport system ATP-binding/permease protein
VPPLIAAQGLSKRFGVLPLFQNLSFTVSEGERIGLIGPNGSGKSTLLEMLFGRLNPDTGDIAVRKRTRVSFVAQLSAYQPGDTVRKVLESALDRGEVPPSERLGRIAEITGRAGFLDLQAEAASLSGGWRKRLAIAEALVQHPDILLLDEPTNHLDLAGIKWLEALLLNANFACVIVSHDRYFLENIATTMVELNRMYPDGSLRVAGNYSTFLEAKEQYLHAQQQRQDALENRVHTEIDWLRRGPKARTTKSKARIDTAHEMIGELAGMRSRSQVTSARIDFTASNRKSKQLIAVKHLSYSIAGRELFHDIGFDITSGTRVGLVGPNGSGKTTFLRLLLGEIAPSAGTVQRADPLRLVYFDQNRVLDPTLSLRRALAPDSDAVIYRGNVVHVASWAARFLFTGEDLNRPVGRMSGGERARVLIAQLMLQPADVLLLDEPTNDLDILTLEILEESLLEYPGALVLVTHDRYMLDRVSTVVLGLDGRGNAQRFADYSQWEDWQRPAKAKPATAANTGKTGRANVAAAAKFNETPSPVAESARPNAPKKKLSYTETRELAGMEESIAAAEEELERKRLAMEEPSIFTDAARLHAAALELEQAQHTVERLYTRWAELEQKQGVTSESLG